MPWKHRTIYRYGLSIYNLGARRRWVIQHNVPVPVPRERNQEPIVKLSNEILFYGTPLFSRAGTEVTYGNLQFRTVCDRCPLPIPPTVHKSDATRANLLFSFRHKASAVLKADCHTLLIAHLLAVRRPGHRLCGFAYEFAAADPASGTTLQIKTKLRGLSPRANYTDRAAAAGRRS